MVFSRDLQSTIPGDYYLYYFNGRLDFQGYFVLGFETQLMVNWWFEASPKKTGLDSEQRTKALAERSQTKGAKCQRKKVSCVKQNPDMTILYP